MTAITLTLVKPVVKPSFRSTAVPTIGVTLSFYPLSLRVRDQLPLLSCPFFPMDFYQIPVAGIRTTTGNPVAEPMNVVLFESHSRKTLQYSLVVADHTIIVSACEDEQARLVFSPKKTVMLVLDSKNNTVFQKEGFLIGHQTDIFTLSLPNRQTIYFASAQGDLKANTRKTLIIRPSRKNGYPSFCERINFQNNSGHKQVGKYFITLQRRTEGNNILAMRCKEGILFIGSIPNGRYVVVENKEVIFEILV